MNQKLFSEIQKVILNVIQSVTTRDSKLDAKRVSNVIQT